VNRFVVTLDISLLLRLSGLNKSDLGATFSAHAPIVELMYSGPLSQQIVIGCPRHWMLRTSRSWSWMISIDRVSLIDIGTDNDSGLALVSHFFGLIRKFNPSFRYIRYTRLWFQPNPLAFPTQRQEAKAKAPSCGKIHQSATRALSSENFAL